MINCSKETKEFFSINISIFIITLISYLLTIYLWNWIPGYIEEAQKSNPWAGFTWAPVIYILLPIDFLGSLLGFIFSIGSIINEKNERRIKIISFIIEFIIYIFLIILFLNVYNKN